NHRQALDYFQQAISLYEETGWLNLALETENDLARCFVSLSEYSSAKEVLRDVYSRSDKLRDSQCKVDAFGMMAEIAYAEGDLEKAIHISNRLTKEIESLSSQFSDMDNLTIFRQKIHHYLQNAVLFEIKNRRLDSAFVKLDYIKARTARYHFMQNRGIAAHSQSPAYFIDIRNLLQQLNDNQLVVNYFISADTLYAFLLNDGEIELLQKPVKIEDIRSLANKFLNSINETIDIFQHQNPAQFIANYDTVTSRGRRLYHLLLDWRELQIRLRDSEITYIIPDDILYGIPFSCLINGDETDMEYLIEQTAIVNIPGAFFLQTQHKFDSEKRNRRVLVCADPQSANTAELIHLIKKKYPRTEEFFINKGVVKKEDILSKLNEDHNIIILIGHSVANTIIPDSSSFELSILNKIDPKPQKVALSLADFKKVDWSATEMVFLIGCETANGKLYEGTGYCGFQQALLARGAQNVLASLWKIDANETINQIVRFLTIWRGQSNPSLALQEVKIQTIRQLQQDEYYKKPHPYLWGSFTLWQTVN
ncbi:CHAT domain-containing protein, partial [candidate division KSB1 bacterium]|nr:CHAT domain-containing protein [candidate division KSB1 bacterium]